MHRTSDRAQVVVALLVLCLLGAAAPPPVGSTVARWTFDDGFQGWTDAGARGIEGFYGLGREWPDDPRPGWGTTRRGFADTPGLTALRHLGTRGVDLESPPFTIAKGEGDLRVRMRFHWVGRGHDVMTVYAFQSGHWWHRTVRREVVRTGIWHDLDLRVREPGQGPMKIRIVTTVPSLLPGDPDPCGLPRTTCELGLRIDDVRVVRGR